LRPKGFLVGIPGISIPCDFTKSDLPIGLQILAAPFEEEKLLRIARMFERATEWHNPATGKASKAGTVTGGARGQSKSPFDGDAVLYLVWRSPG
jgi:hypothetical protein